MRRSVAMPVAVVAYAVAAGTASYAGSTTAAGPAGSASYAVDDGPAGLTSYAVADDAALQTVSRGVRHVPVPTAARAVDTSRPDHVIGDGSAASCTGPKVVRAVKRGGVITFDCGPDPVVIAMTHTAKS